MTRKAQDFRPAMEPIIRRVEVVGITLPRNKMRNSGDDGKRPSSPFFNIYGQYDKNNIIPESLGAL